MSSQILLAQLVILAASTTVGFFLFAHTVRQNLNDEFQARAAAIAESVASVPAIQGCLAHEGAGCGTTVQDIALATARRTGAAYVVVIDTNRVRHSHPDPALIGQKISEPLMARDGKVHVGTDSGSTGLSANARVPLYGPSGSFAGEVSVGIRESSVSGEVLRQLPSYGAWLAVVFAIGTVASFGLAGVLKRRTFGLELDEIARLLQEREATLHGIREGVIALDPAGRISVLNDHARRLLNLSPDALRRRLEDVVTEGPLRDLLTGAGKAFDALVITDDHCLVVNRMPVSLNGRPHGVVVTLRDRSDVEGLARELAGERSLTESLRAQQHEYSNRMHVIAGLLELGEPQDALAYVHEIRGTLADLDQTLRQQIRAPQIIGLMLGKITEAGERGIALTVTPETSLGEHPARLQALTTILGNLIDNAFDVLADCPPPRSISVSVVESEVDVTVVVTDNGPGIPPEASPYIFTNGFTTKRGTLVRHRGLGLSLVQNTVSHLGGTVTVSEGAGATFTVWLPVAVAAPDQSWAAASSAP